MCDDMNDQDYTSMCPKINTFLNATYSANLTALKFRGSDNRKRCAKFTRISLYVQGGQSEIDSQSLFLIMSKRGGRRDGENETTAESKLRTIV